MTTEMKTCEWAGCEVAFEARSVGKRTRRYCSKSCKQKADGARQYARHREAILTRQSKRRQGPEYRVSEAKRLQDDFQTDPVRFVAFIRWNGAKQRANEHGVPFEITKEHVRDLLEHALAHGCAVTGDPIRLYAPGKAGGKMQPDSPSLDKRDPALGYVPGNCRVVTWAYNARKKDFTPHDMKREICLEFASRPNLLPAIALLAAYPPAPPAPPAPPGSLASLLEPLRLAVRNWALLAAGLLIPMPGEAPTAAPS